VGTFYDLIASYFPSLRRKPKPRPAPAPPGPAPAPPAPAPAPKPQPTPHPAPIPTLPPAPSASDLVTALNAERARAGLAPLREDPRLTKAAQAWADQMAAAHRLWHGNLGTRLVDVIPGALSEAEDIAAGQQNVRDVVSDWMESPPHRANILGDFNLVGCGQATSSTGAIFWCVDFARANDKIKGTIVFRELTAPPLADPDEF
jgi:uncharacterized protein YkwD